MPYTTNASLPERIKLPEHAKTIFRNAFNSAEKQHGSNDEARLFRIAYGAVKNAGYTQDKDGTWVAKTYKTEPVLLEIPITKIDVEQRKAFGWASIAKHANGQHLVDRQDDVLHIPSMEQSVYTYVMESGDGGEMHTRTGVAKLCESVFFTPQKCEAMGLASDAIAEGSWWIGMHVVDDDAWDGVKSGKYATFSIGGMGDREPWEEEA